MTDNVYLRFLELTQTLENQGHLSGVDPTAGKLLEAIAVACSQNKALNVSDVMALKSIASPATLHRKIEDLVTAGYVEYRFLGHDRRVKFLYTTEAANRYFENMGEALVRMMK